MKTGLINECQITVKDISVNDYLLFEEKKISPDDSSATNKSIGYNDAIIWLFNNYYECNGNRLTRDLLEEKNFEAHHVLRLLELLLKTKAKVTLLDSTDNVENSDLFQYRTYTVERIKCSWSEAKKLTINSRNKQLSPIDVNKKLIKKYFNINGQTITEDYFNDPSKLPIDLFILLTTRLGKLLRD